MPREPWFWIGAIIAVLALSCLAIWLGRNISLQISRRGFAFKTTTQQIREASDKANILDTVKVGENAEVRGGIDDVIGRVDKRGTPQRGITEVGKQMKIRGSKF